MFGLNNSVLDYLRRRRMNQVGGIDPYRPDETPDPPRQRWLTRDSYMGQEVPEELGIEARNRGLVGFGTALLAGGLSNDYGGTLARGIAAFQGAQDESLGQGLAARRQQERDELEKRRLDQQMQAAEEERGYRREDQDFQRGERQRVAGARVATGHAATDMVGAIEDAAGDDSPEAQQARILASLGEAADLDDLRALHAAAITRKRQPEEDQRAIDRQIKLAEAEAAAGFGPKLSARNEAERLAMDRERLGMERTRMARDNSPGYNTQLADDIRYDARDIYEARKSAYVDKLKDWQERQKQRFGPDPKDPRPSFDFSAERARAREEAASSYMRPGSITQPAAAAPNGLAERVRGNLPALAERVRVEGATAAVQKLASQGIPEPEAKQLVREAVGIKPGQQPAPRPASGARPAPAPDPKAQQRVVALLPAAARASSSPPGTLEANVRSRLASGEDPIVIERELAEMVRQAQQRRFQELR